MRPSPRLALFTPLLLALLAPLPVLAQADEIKPVEKPYLWVIEGESNSYLYGTIHLPDARVTTLPKVVEEAIADSDGLFCELKMDMATQMGAQKFTQLPPGQTLKGVVPAELYGRVEAYVQSKGIPALAMLGNLKPGILAAQLGIFDYMAELQQGKQPLDSVLYSKAQAAGKEVGGLEEVAEQMGVFDSLSTEVQLKMLKDSMDEIDEAKAEGKRPTDKLLEVYMAGDLDAVQKMADEENDPEDEEQQKFMKLMVDDRNVRMADRLSKKIADNGDKSYFFAVGVLHYPGKMGILALLKAKGLKVRRLSAADAGTLKREPAGAGAGGE